MAEAWGGERSRTWDLTEKGKFRAGYACPSAPRKQSSKKGQVLCPGSHQVDSGVGDRGRAGHRVFQGVLKNWVWRRELQMLPELGACRAAEAAILTWPSCSFLVPCAPLTG